jgi:hypothetical protein
MSFLSSHQHIDGPIRKPHGLSVISVKIFEYFAAPQKYFAAHSLGTTAVNNQKLWGRFVVMYLNHFSVLQISVIMSIYRNFINSHVTEVSVYLCLRFVFSICTKFVNARLKKIMHVLMCGNLNCQSNLLQSPNCGCNC